MLTPDYLAHCADEIIELYQPLQETIIRDIVRRLAKTGSVTAMADWQLMRLQESGLLYNEILTEVSKLSGISKAKLVELFQEAGVKAVEHDTSIYKAAGLSPPPIPLMPGAMEVLTAGLNKTHGLLNNLTMTTANSAQQAYIRACTLAEMQVTSGAFDFHTAVKNAIHSALSESPMVYYPSGHKDRLDVAVRRSVLTGVGQTTGQIGLAYAEHMGCDLMEITAHSGARPSHARWQGKLVSLSGRPGYLSLSDIGYRTGPGFKGWNCRHDWFPFFEGLSEAAYSRKQLEDYENQRVTYGGKEMSVYEASQLQRVMERRIRESKRKLAGYDEAIKNGVDMKSEFSHTSMLLKKQEAGLRDFCRQTNLRNQSPRVQVAGFGRSQAQKAVQAHKAQVLPNYKQASIPDSKISGYSLDMNHTTGKNKAVAFEKALGYNIGNASQLTAELHRNLPLYPAKQRPHNGFGLPFEVKMKILGANGKTAWVDTGWIIDDGQKNPRLTSAYVAKEKKK